MPQPLSSPPGPILPCHCPRHHPIPRPPSPRLALPCLTPRAKPRCHPARPPARPPRPLPQPRAPCPAPLPQASPSRKASSSAPPRPHSPARRPALPGGRALELQREGLLDDAVVHLEQDHVGAGGGERLSARRGRREPSPLRAPGTRPSLRRRFRSRAHASLPARLPRSRAVAAVVAHEQKPPVVSCPPPRDVTRYPRLPPGGVTVLGGRGEQRRGARGEPWGARGRGVRRTQMEARAEGCSGNGGPRSTRVPPRGWGAAGGPQKRRARQGARWGAVEWGVPICGMMPQGYGAPKSGTPTGSLQLWCHQRCESAPE